jgi:hypothetical protein
MALPPPIYRVWVRIEESKPDIGDLKRTVLEMIDFGYSARDIARRREVKFEAVLQLFEEPERTQLCDGCSATGEVLLNTQSGESVLTACSQCRGQGWWMP